MDETADTGNCRLYRIEGLFDKRQIVTLGPIRLGVVLVTVAVALLSLAIPVGATAVQNRASPQVMATTHLLAACESPAKHRGACGSGNAENASPAWGTSDTVIFLIGAAWIVAVGALSLIEHVRGPNLSSLKTSLSKTEGHCDLLEARAFES